MEPRFDSCGSKRALEGRFAYFGGGGAGAPGELKGNQARSLAKTLAVNHSRSIPRGQGVEEQYPKIIGRQSRLSRDDSFSITGGRKTRI
jgi:hypothetical protein